MERPQKPNQGSKRRDTRLALKLLMLVAGLASVALGQRAVPAQPGTTPIARGHRLGDIWADRDSFWAVRIGEEGYASEVVRLFLPPHVEPAILNLTLSLLTMAPTSARCVPDHPAELPLFWQRNISQSGEE